MGDHVPSPLEPSCCFRDALPSYAKVSAHSPDPVSRPRVSLLSAARNQIFASYFEGT